MRMRSRVGWVTLAVCVRFTLQSVHVAIEMHTHHILVVLKQVDGAGSLATLKGGLGPGSGYNVHIYTYTCIYTYTVKPL